MRISDWSSDVCSSDLSTEGDNRESTTRGNEIIVQFNPGSTAGKASNTGLITAATGDITLTGNSIEQAGVLLASTSVHNRGTVHLTATGADPKDRKSTRPNTRH